MSQKHKRRTSRDAPASTPLSNEALADKARAALERGDFRTAIANFKTLSKQNPSDESRAGLTAAYAGRARELAAKGMLKEALVMWENRASVDPTASLEPDQCDLMLRLDRIDPLLEQLNDPKTSPASADHLRARFASRILGGDQGLTDHVDPEDPLRRHCEPARAALLAYCAGDDAAARTALAQIPFRSPYRDWSAILKALLSLADNPADTERQLARVPADSAFTSIKEAAELAILPEPVFLERSRALGRNRMHLACTLRGWSPKRIAFWEHLRRLGETPKPESLLSFLQTHRKQLGEPWARQRQLRTLLRHLPESERWLRNTGAKRIDTVESMLLAAWRTELKPNAWDLQERWGHFAQALEVERHTQASIPQRELAIALAFRRADSLMDLLSTTRTPAGEMDDLQDFVCEALESSLQWDPEDRATYLRLIRFYRHAQELKDARRLLDAASKRWPKDRQILLETMELALATGAFKKAAGLAQQILAIDPINTEVRGRLVDAHLSHARKQVFKSRLDLARKELTAASEWIRGEQAREQVELLSGLVTFLDNPLQGKQALSDIAKRLGQGFAARIALTLSAGTVGIEPEKILRFVDLEKPVKPDHADLLAGLERLRLHLDAKQGFSRGFETFLSKALAKAPWKELSRGESESICETLRRAQMHTIRQELARVALKRWRKAPIFMLHAFEAKYPNGCYDPMNKDLLDLEIALDTARSEGDTRTSLRIQETLERSRPFTFGSGPFGGPFDLDDEDEDEYDFFDDLDLPPGFDAMDDSPEALITFLRTIGIEKVLDLMDAPPHVRRDMRETLKSIGEDAFFKQIIEAIKETQGMGGIPLPGGSKPKPGGRKRRR